MTLLTRSSLRYLTRHPWLMGLSVLGVALGVAVVVAIDLANASAQEAFALSTETVTGKATHQVVGPAETLDGDTYRRLRVEADVRKAAPVVSGYATLQRGDRTFQVLGVDPFAEGPFRPYVGRTAGGGAGDGDADGGAGGVDLGAFMAGQAVLMAAPTARTLGLAPGDTLGVEVEGVVTRLPLGGLLDPANERSQQAVAGLLVMDVSTAQRLFDLPGQLSRIDLLVPDGPAGEQMLRRVRRVLPDGAQVQRAAARSQTVEQMTRAFRLNLQALSLLALVVGAFLIYNTMTFSVVQRRGLIGRLRALGVTRGEIFRLVVTEAAIIAAVGTALGLLAGVVLALGLVQLLTQTINDLYFVLTVRELSLDPFTLAKGTALGLGTTILAALAPAREATNAPVSAVLRRSTEETNVRALLPRLALGGVAVALLGVGLLLVPGRSILVGYAALFCVLVAAALLTPLAVVAFAKGLRPVLGAVAGVLGRMAARGVVTTLSRTSVAIAALMIAIAATVGVGIMIDSFRGTVEAWLGQALQADVYVQPPSLVFRRSEATLQPDVVEALRTADGVAGAYAVRRVDVTALGVGRSDLAAIEVGPHTPAIYRFKSGEVDWDAFQTDRAVVVSEPYAYRYGVAAGDTLRLVTDRGPVAFPVRGVFYDYASDVGVVLMTRGTYVAVFDDRGVSGLALNAAPGQDVDALLADLRARVGGLQDVLIRSNRDLRQTSLEVFDRTFTITTVLRLLALIVAFIGILSALMALQLERERELAVMRATGMTPGQIGRYVTLQTGVMGLVAGLLAWPLGYALAYVLVYVINKRSFGWTLQLEVAPGILAQALVLALVAAVLGGAYPAYRMAQARPADALRDA